MEIKSFDTILNEICDFFDSLIAPKKIARTNTNIFYLILKACSKGWEVINNVCVVLSNKFDPAKCSVEDLNSVAFIVGTERHKGSASGLRITVTNNAEESKTLVTGVYKYVLDEDTTFIFELFNSLTIQAGSYTNIIAMSEKIGSFPVTEQASITIESEQTIPSDVSFSCTNNENLLGVEPESNLDFRKRILTGVDNQDSIVELENTLRNLPYFFDCRVKFNDTLNAIEYDGITIPPFSACIFFSGAPRSDVAGVIANKIICPTIQTEDSIAIPYESSVFVDGEHIFNLIPFKKTLFTVNVTYQIENVYINANAVEEQMRKALYKAFSFEVHQDFVKEDDVYNVIESLNLTGINLLSVNLYYNGTHVDYVNVPVSRIPEITDIDFTREE